jgi:hypothetical protein
MLPIPPDVSIGVLRGVAAIAKEGLTGDLQTKDSFNWVDVSIKSLDLASLIPTHGNFAGPGYGAGERGEHTSEQLELYPVHMVTDPLTGIIRPDEIDSIAKVHDIAYNNAKDQPDYWQQIKAADQTLVDKTRKILEQDKLGIIKLTDGERNYGIAMLELFEMKLRYIDQMGAIAEDLRSRGYSLVQINDMFTNLFSLAAFYPNPLSGAQMLFNTFRQLFTLTSTLPIFSVSPIILDLDGNGIETINVKDGAYFDHGGNGFAEQTGWASSDEGFLVMDRNEDGIINDGKEFFGSETLLSNGTKAANGFQALVI